MPPALPSCAGRTFAPKTVIITSLQRTRQTAEVLFPDAELVVADGLNEMNFGVFEGRNYREMEHDPQYRAWVETGCEGRCPGGESKAEFCQRVCTAFAALVDAALAAGEPTAGDRCPRRHPDGGAGTVRLCPIKTIIPGVLPRRAALCWMPPIGYTRKARSARGQNRAVYKGGHHADLLGRFGWLCAGCHFWRPGLAAAPRCADGQSHLRAGKTPARTICPKRRRGTLRRGGSGRHLPVGTFLITALVCRLAAALHPLAGLAVQMFWCAQALAAKGLVQESRNVYKELQKQDLPAARKAVARIVGRDTQNLTTEGVTKAAVETVAENASDGVIAPLLYMLLGGAPLALTYKAINTMDSMLGYKNQKYLYFGRAAARLDDVANYLPAAWPGCCGLPLPP